MSFSIVRINELIKAERVCRRNGAACPLSGATFVGMDASREEFSPGDIPVLFLGLNPGRREAELGRPFVGPSGELLRSAIAEAGIADWAIYSILCFTPNEASIPDQAGCRESCAGNVRRLWACVRPSVIVPCGNGACGVFGLSGGMRANMGRRYLYSPASGRATVVMPITHPSAVLRNGGAGSSADREFRARMRAIADMLGKIDRERDDLGLDARNFLRLERHAA